jgi:hypothetical protein
MENETTIKVLLLSTNESLISEIAEVYAELGDPNCKLTNPYLITSDGLVPWMGDYTDQNEMMIQSDKILTLVDPNEKYLTMYQEAIQ